MSYIHSSKQDFAALEAFISPYKAKGRTESAALLLWFLEILYRLDDTEAQDAVCDRKHDAGMDAIVISDITREIAVFQAKRKEKLPSTLGDTDLKNFVGSLAQLKSESSVKKLISTTRNEELKKLLVDGDVAKKISDGYKIRPIFVCNAAANEDAMNYLSHASGIGAKIELWDLIRLSPVLKQLSRDWFLDEQVKIKVAEGNLFYFGTKTSPRLVYTAVRANELVKLPGIDDSRIFAQNVRLGLGKTRVNRDIENSIKNKSDHADFLTFHNGLTIVAQDIKVRGTIITLSGLSVCNGCQSLLAFYENRKLLTDKLEVLVRIVKVGEDRKLPETIAYRTNNQNAISLRDLNSNDSAQLRLKAEFDQLYGDYSSYSIKRGETVSASDLKNEEAGRMLLALYLRDPTSTHQKYKIFGELEPFIFSIDTTAPRIRLSQILCHLIAQSKQKIESERVAKYGLTTFVILHFVGELMRKSKSGNELLRDPSPFLRSSANPLIKEEKTCAALQQLIDHSIVELNYFVKDNGGENYDYKSEFKSPKAIDSLTNLVLKAYEKDLTIGRRKHFSLT